MALFTGNGYLVASITALLAIPASDRPAFRVALLVQGSSWYEYDNAATTGGLIPADLPTTGRWFAMAREVLRANRTYYVRTDGNDSNNGLADISSAAFLTAIGARNAIRKIDGNGFAVTVKFADGTYNSTQIVWDNSFVGIPTLFLEGNTTTPFNVVISGATGMASATGVFDFSGAQKFEVTGFTFTNTQTGGDGLAARNGASVITKNNVWSVCNRAQIEVFSFASVEQVGNMTINGNAAVFGNVSSGQLLLNSGGVGTLVGSPSFSIFIQSTNGSAVSWISSAFSWSGSATGSRYNATKNGIIETYNLGGSFPGNSAGTTSLGGQYS